MTDDPRPCPRRTCNGQLLVAEEATLNGVEVTYWDCNDPLCDYSERTEEAGHEQPRLL